MKTHTLTLAVCTLGAAFCAVAAEPQYHWRQTNDSLALTRGEEVLWQLNAQPGERKPYFHPLCLPNGVPVTVARPADHLWHYGLWWSWKYINGLNYWEEDKVTGRSQGVTEVVKVQPVTRPDGSARVEMDLSYHPPGKPSILNEKRVLSISAPDSRGNYFIDWDSTFTAGAEDLKFDRTPPSKGAGGYAGLALRFPPEGRTGWTFTSSEGLTGAPNIYGTTARWVDFSKGHGVAVFDHPENPRHPTLWYPNQGHPFINPAFLFNEPYELAAKKSFRLRYRVFLHSESLNRDALQQQWKEFAKGQPGGN